MSAACGSTTSTKDPLDGEVVLLLDAEPPWSYLYRKTIPVLAAADLRALAVGLVGCGRSDKPTHRDDSTYQAHINWTWRQSRRSTSTPSPWSTQTGVGLLGLRLVGEHPDRYAGVVAANIYPPAGDRPPSDAFMAWQRYCQDSPELRYGGSCTAAASPTCPPTSPPATTPKSHRRLPAAVHGPAGSEGPSPRGLPQRPLAHTDLCTQTADGSWDILVPGPLVIDRSGIVRARYVSADYLTRMDPDDIEAALVALDWPERQCLRPAI